MFGYKWYTVFGWTLTALLAVLGLRWAAEVLFEPHRPAKLGLAVELAEAPAAEAPAAVDLGTLLASADAARGAKTAKQCGACHNFDKGGPKIVGPNLWGVLGSPIASKPDFTYSAGMKAFSAGGKTWTYEQLFQFLEAPGKVVSGTAMTFAGLKKPTDRADVLAYLNTLTPAPIAFPAPVAAPAEAATTAPAPATAAPASVPPAPGPAQAAAPTK